MTDARIRLAVRDSPLRPHLPTLHDVACQASRDWFGKDVQETPTVSYVWTADQFGHFGLGLFITYAATWLVALLGQDTPTTHVLIAAANFLLWVGKEVNDFFHEKTVAKRARSPFKFNARELWWNIATALFYIATGIVVAGASFLGPRAPLGAGIALLLPSLVIGVWWLKRKIIFQQAGLPYLYRLANFPNNLENPRIIEALCNPAQMPGCRHMVISGPIGAGKTSLAVGVGTEFAFRKGIGRYTTLVKLLQSNLKDQIGNTTEFQDGRILWPWQSSDLLVVDDVDDAGDIAARLTDPNIVTEPPIAQVRLALSRLIDDRVKARLASRRSIWVIGDTDPIPWRDMLHEVFGIEDGAIGSIVLTETIGRAVANSGHTVHPGGL